MTKPSPRTVNWSLGRGLAISLARSSKVAVWPDRSTRYSARRQPAAASDHPRRPPGHRRRDRGRRVGGRRATWARRRPMPEPRLSTPRPRRPEPTVRPRGASARPGPAQSRARLRRQRTHAPHRHQAGADDRDAEASRGRHGPEAPHSTRSREVRRDRLLTRPLRHTCGGLTAPCPGYPSKADRRWSARRCARLG
jgi:hypothetical protein